MGPRARRLLLCLVLGACASPAWAVDPILMLLFSAAREIASAAMRRESAAPPPVLPPSGSTYPGTAVEPAAMRRLIDECFTYLSDAQRGEIFAALHAALMDPKNAALRGSMIDHFAARAFAVREAQERLAKLSDADQDRLVAEFQTAVAVLPPEEAAQVAAVLRAGALPLPSDLSNRLLAALDAR